MTTVTEPQNPSPPHLQDPALHTLAATIRRNFYTGRRRWLVSKIAEGVAVFGNFYGREPVQQYLETALADLLRFSAPAVAEATRHDPTL